MRSSWFLWAVVYGVLVMVSSHDVVTMTPISEIAVHTMYVLVPMSVATLTSHRMALTRHVMMNIVVLVVWFFLWRLL